MQTQPKTRRRPVLGMMPMTPGGTTLFQHLCAFLEPGLAARLSRTTERQRDHLERWALLVQYGLKPATVAELLDDCGLWGES